jgi:hypothetical protein
MNRAIRDEEGRIVDVICGDFFICGLGEEDFVGLEDEMVEKYKEMFGYPETFVRIGNSIVGIPYDPEGLADE